MNKMAQKRFLRNFCCELKVLTDSGVLNCFLLCFSADTVQLNLQQIGLRWQKPISKDLETPSKWLRLLREEPLPRVINHPSEERETQTSRGSRVPGFHSHLGETFLL